MSSDGGKSKKIGRNKVRSASYKNSGRREQNKALRVYAHLVRVKFTDQTAVAKFNSFEARWRKAACGTNEVIPVRGTSHLRKPPKIRMPYGKGCPPTPKLANA